MNTKRKRGPSRWVLAVLVAGFYLLHQDFWNWDRAEPFWLGFLPVGLAYHVMYSVGAAGLLWVLVRWAWPRGLESESGSGTGARTDRPERGGQP